jgi:hypothetical protein
MSYDRRTTTRRTTRQIARIVRSIPQKPQRRVRRSHRAASTMEHGVVTPGEPNRAHRRRYGGSSLGHSLGRLPFREAMCRARGLRRRRRAHRRRMACR